ncbi:MAG: magnesium/cobalt transporter CorA [Bacillota bacterium]|nr:magnesium/cobalt transporter CorA [Bacillota bacterium]
MARLILSTRSGREALSPGDAEAALRAALGRGESFWLDVHEPGSDQLGMLERVLGLHPLAATEVKRPSQLPRVEVYPDYTVLVFHAVEVDREGRIPVHRAEVDCILGSRFLVTVHVREVSILGEMQRLLAGGAPFPATPDLLLAGIIDLLVKQLYDALDYLADRIAALEERVISGRLRNPMPEVTAIRRALVRLRHGLGPEEQAISDLAGLSNLVGEGARVAMRQAVDLLRRMWDGVEVERDLVDNVVQVYLALRTDRLNVIMQRLTLITTIFMPLTLIAGIYGMNFHHMPELAWRYGYPATLLLMVITGYGMYRWFRARGWFGEP